ncbi:MAG: hypothetical protein II892_10980 [Fibrobacter sp.]|nr:hypothetical protein [Fibrobacter sp.]
MKKQLLVACAIFLVTTICVTCGDETAGAMGDSTNGVIQIAKDVDLFKYECDISRSGMTVRIEATDEVVVCQYDEYLEDWSWSPQK